MGFNVAGFNALGSGAPAVLFGGWVQNYWVCGLCPKPLETFGLLGHLPWGYDVDSRIGALKVAVSDKGKKFSNSAVNPRAEYQVTVNELPPPWYSIPLNSSLISARSCSLSLAIITVTTTLMPTYPDPHPSLVSGSSPASSLGLLLSPVSPSWAVTDGDFAS